MARIKEIISHLESIAPRSYQESYDNSGLLTGDMNAEVSGVLVTLDVTEKVVEEAMMNGDNLIIAHHPIIFSGLKTLTGKNYVEKTIIKAIKNDIAIYAIHTNLDNIHLGVNKKIADKVGLLNCQILAPKSNVLNKLTVFIPIGHEEQVKEALFQAGAGEIGNYSECGFSVKGTGQFKPNEQSNPTIGSSSKLERVEEMRLEVLIPKYKAASIINAMKSAHPYEEVAYFLTPLSNSNQEVGSGMIGELESEISTMDFLSHLKDRMELKVIRHTPIVKETVKKIAICGGSGSFLTKNAIQQRADVFISADFKYHDFFDAENHLIIADIGHYESEAFTKELLVEILSEKFHTFALNLSKTVTNPISYL